MAEEYVSLQPYYDDTDFKVGQLVTCMRLQEMPDFTKDLFADCLEYRQIDFCGLITNIGSEGVWLMVEYREPNDEIGGKIMKAIFHKDELGMGYQPSWHPMVAVDSIQTWLKNND